MRESRLSFVVRILHSLLAFSVTPLLAFSSVSRCGVVFHVSCYMILNFSFEFCLNKNSEDIQYFDRAEHYFGVCCCSLVD